MTDPRITNEMVEAAARNIELYSQDFPFEWSVVPDSIKDERREQARAALSAAIPLMDGEAAANEAQHEIDRLRRTLVDVRDNGLIYWEPRTRRGHISKAEMWGRINGVLPPAPKGDE